MEFFLSPNFSVLVSIILKFLWANSTIWIICQSISMVFLPLTIGQIFLPFHMSSNFLLYPGHCIPKIVETFIQNTVFSTKEGAFFFLLSTYDEKMITSVE